MKKTKMRCWAFLFLKTLNVSDVIIYSAMTCSFCLKYYYANIPILLLNLVHVSFCPSRKLVLGTQTLNCSSKERPNCVKKIDKK